MLRHGRYDHVPITSRPWFSWPGGNRLAVCVARGVECYEFGAGMVENLVPGGKEPHDVPDASWRDYGSRVGAWRVMEAMRELGMPLTIPLNTVLHEEAPALARAFRTQGCEIVAHGRPNSDIMAGMTEDQECRYIAGVTRAIHAAGGHAPQGWTSPWITGTLQDAGYGYLLDWCIDDQPCWLRTRQGRLLSLLFSQEINDSATVIGRMASASELADLIIDQFEQLLQSSRQQPLVMSAILHSFIAGQPFRLRRIRTYANPDLAS